MKVFKNRKKIIFVQCHDFFFFNTLNHPIIYTIKMPEKKSDLFSGQTPYFNEM